MKSRHNLVLAVIVLAAMFFSPVAVSAEAKISVCFLPTQPCMSIVLQLISKAQKSIYMFSYSFQSKAFVNALVAAKKRGVKVSVLVDEVKAEKKIQGNRMLGLEEGGVTVTIYDGPQKQHIKAVVIDGHQVVTGSMNWSDSEDVENDVVFIQDPDIARRFINKFKVLSR